MTKVKVTYTKVRKQKKVFELRKLFSILTLVVLLISSFGILPAPTKAIDDLPLTATLNVVKETVGGDGSFSFSGTGDIANFSIVTSSGTGSQLISLEAGTYSLSENATAGWTLNSHSCVYGDESIGAAIENGEQITVDAGDEVTCTFVNTKDAPEAPETPPTDFHFIKVICPSYSDIAGNGDAANLDASGGNYIQFNNYDASADPNFPTPYELKPISEAEIPKNCVLSQGWQFKLSTDQDQTQDTSVVGPTDVTGQFVKDFSELSTNQQGALLAGERLWVSEVPQPEVAAFGTIRCYQDAVNGDNLEFINLGGDPLAFPENVYCIAYNVNPNINSKPTLHLLKVICPAYSDIAGNADANVEDATGGKYTEFSNFGSFPTGHPSSPVDPSEIPEKCTKTADWGFLLTTDQAQQTDQQTYTTGASGAADVELDSLPTALKNALEGGQQIWASEIIPENPPAAFGALRCYKDGFNGDNLEFLQLDPENIPLDIYCIAYNVRSGGGEGGEDPGDGNPGGSGPFTLTVTISHGEGDGTGSVTGTTTPDGLTEIACTSAGQPENCSATYAAGTEVTLTAAANEGSNFTGTWSGDCTGDNPVCTFTMTSNKTVNAHFSLNSNPGTGCTSNCGSSSPGPSPSPPPGGSAPGVVGLPSFNQSQNGGTNGGTTPPSDGSTPPGLVLGAASPQPQVLGDATLPRTGMPTGFLLLVFAAAAAVLNKKLKLV